jgi:hypothetical protein
MENQEIIDQYLKQLKNKSFPCVAAHDAATKNSIRCFVANHFGCPQDDQAILNFLYDFTDEYRNADSGYHSAAILFRSPQEMSEELFDEFLWRRLQSLADLDAMNYGYDPRVTPDTTSPKFSFSLKEEAFYVIGLHAGSSRKARKFKYPTLVFNPHAQFEKLREENHYSKMQQIVRKRDILFSGSINPMLADFGSSPEVFQYSGRKYDKDWKCPLKLSHASTKHNPSS